MERDKAENECRKVEADDQLRILAETNVLSSGWLRSFFPVSNHGSTPGSPHRIRSG